MFKTYVGVGNSPLSHWRIWRYCTPNIISRKRFPHDLNFMKHDKKQIMERGHLKLLMTKMKPKHWKVNNLHVVLVDQFRVSTFMVSISRYIQEHSMNILCSCKKSSERETSVFLSHLLIQYMTEPYKHIISVNDQRHSVKFLWLHTFTLSPIIFTLLLWTSGGEIFTFSRSLCDYVTTKFLSWEPSDETPHPKLATYLQ